MGGKTSAKSKNNWIAKTYDRINLTVPKGEKEAIAAAAKQSGESVNAYIYNAVRERMQREVIQGGMVSGFSTPTERETVYVGSSPMSGTE